MKPLLQLPLWQRVVFVNVVGATGVCLGFADSRVKVSAIAAGYIATFTMTLLNLMLLAVPPRIQARKTARMPGSGPWRALYEVLAERPFITALLILQLVRVAQAAGAAIIFFQGPGSQYFRGVPNLQSLTPYIYLTGWFMTAVAFLWLVSAIGLWHSRVWGWWLALVLNGSDVVLQLLNLHKLSLHPLSEVAVLLLVLPNVRVKFRRGRPAEEVAR